MTTHVFKQIKMKLVLLLTICYLPQEENERLQAKIDGLKQEYEKIGLQVQNLITFFHTFFYKMEAKW